MAFIVRNQRQRNSLPEGNYVTLEGVQWLVQSVNMNNSGMICIKLHDPVRLQNQLVTVCSIEELAKLIPGAE